MEKTFPPENIVSQQTPHAQQCYKQRTIFWRVFPALYTSLCPLGTWAVVQGVTYLDMCVDNRYPSSLLSTGACALTALFIFAVSFLWKKNFLVHIPILFLLGTFFETCWFLVLYAQDVKKSMVGNEECRILHDGGIVFCVGALSLLSMLFFGIHMSLLGRELFYRRNHRSLPPCSTCEHNRF